MYALVVHGGAGYWHADLEEEAVSGAAAAARAGHEVLKKGGAAVDAVTAAVVALEDAPIFNAGTGAALNVDGKVEMDAAVSTGSDLRTGAVANLPMVKNPVLVARQVMELTDHVMLAGDGAERFARALGFPEYNPVTEIRRRSFDEKFARLKTNDDKWLPRLRTLLKKYPELSHGTVGAAALDESGELAAATSTGGVVLKLTGRVGDTPIPGAGNYATRHAASSATGRGELIMRALSTRAVCDAVARGETIQAAIEQTLGNMTETLGDDVGIIGVDANGRVGIGHATRNMPHAWVTSDAEVQARMRVE